MFCIKTIPEKNPKNPRKPNNPNNPRKPEVEKPEFYWFGLVYKFKNPTQLVWFGV